MKDKKKHALNQFACKRGKEERDNILFRLQSRIDDKFYGHFDISPLVENDVFPLLAHFANYPAERE